MSRKHPVLVRTVIVHMLPARGNSGARMGECLALCSFIAAPLAKSDRANGLAQSLEVLKSEGMSRGRKRGGSAQDPPIGEIGGQTADRG
jgi:hypothetical protein